MQKHACRQQEKRREPRGDEIEHIVELRRNQADIFIGRLDIAEHGVHRVDRLIEKAEPGTAEREIKKRRDDPVGCIFRHGFDCRARNARFIEPFRIAPDDHGDRLLRVRKRRSFERSIDLHALALQRFCRENLPAHDALQRQAQIDGNPLRRKKKENRNGSGDCRREKPDQTPCENLAARIFGAEPPEKPLQNGNQLADGDHRVRKAVRVADQKIEKRTEQQRIQGPFHEQAPPFCSVKIQTGFCAFIRW